ncbi:MAG: ATP-dependent DNA ligase [Propionibacteriales bacterium]|nr:ATP-dependent DNA ligase [Propionibacteriales bacterium]
MLLKRLVDASREIGATRSRTRKTEIISEVLTSAESDEIETVVAYLSGELRQRRTGVGWRTLMELPKAADEPQLTVADVHDRLEEISRFKAAGSQAARREAVRALFGRATEAEQAFLRALIGGELRHGALDGVMLAATAHAARIPAARIRRAVMLRGATGPVAAVALTEGERGLEAFHLTLGQPVRPMLASTANTVAEALTKVAPDGAEAAVEWKLDGIRVQVHREGDRVRVFTRSLDEITTRVPEIVEAALTLPVTSAVLDGEAIALGERGRPRPFQETGSRTASSADVDDLRLRVPLSTYFFDLLHLDGEDVLDLPAGERQRRLDAVVPDAHVVPRVVTASTDEAQAFFADAVEQGHEGVVVKQLSGGYDAGRRGAGWIKVKPRHTLDLVVLAAEWGHGRRQGWLSNLHLGARDESTGELVMLGKTFKGLTDRMLTWQTEHLLALERHRDGHIVWVRPEPVVEVAFDGVQTSSRYPAGMALRFARVLRYRTDKTAAEADTAETVRAIHRRDERGL